MQFNIDPIAFRVFGIPIRWYGILIALGVFLAMLVVDRLSKKEGMDENTISQIFFAALFFGIIGARIYYVIFKWDYYKANPGSILNIREGGLAIYGGIIAGLIAIFVYTRIKRISFFRITDILAPGVILAQSIGRWGNFVNQEAYGYPTDLPWGLIIDGQKVHPTFLYESLGDFIIFIILYKLFSSKKYDGKITYLYMLLYGVLRFFVEGLRQDSLYIGPLRVSQLVSLLLAVAGLLLLFIKARTKKNK